MKQDPFESKLFKGIILGIAGLIVLSVVFTLGVAVGVKKAEFSFKWADQYHNNFGGPQRGVLGGNMMGGDFTESNGVFGQIIKINDKVITIKGRDNVEKNLLLNDKTTVVFQRKNINVGDLKINDIVVAIGDPDGTGQIFAELIRVMPAIPQNLPQGNLLNGPATSGN